MRDDLTDALRYAVKPQLLVAYLVAFVGEFVRGFWLSPPLQPGTTAFEVISFILGPFNFLLDLAGYFLVAVGTVAVLWIVLSDVVGDGSTPDLPSFGSSDGDRSDDGATDDGATDDGDDAKPAHSADPAAEEADTADQASAGNGNDADDGPWNDE